jgi:hypothetical protein
LGRGGRAGRGRVDEPRAVLERRRRLQARVVHEFVVPVDLHPVTVSAEVRIPLRQVGGLDPGRPGAVAALVLHAGDQPPRVLLRHRQVVGLVPGLDPGVGPGAAGAVLGRYVQQRWAVPGFAKRTMNTHLRRQHGNIRMTVAPINWMTRKALSVCTHGQTPRSASTRCSGVGASSRLCPAFVVPRC